MKEYNSTSTNSYNCYSTLHSYSVNGKFRETVINPTPASITPQLFWRIRPHKIPIVEHKENDNAHYKNLNSYCNS